MLVPVLKGLKPTKEEALPPVFYIRRLKTDGKIEPAAQGVALLKTTAPVRAVREPPLPTPLHSKLIITLTCQLSPEKAILAKKTVKCSFIFDLGSI